MTIAVQAPAGVARRATRPDPRPAAALAAEPGSLPEPARSRRSAADPTVLFVLGQISQAYSAARARVNYLRLQGPHDDPDRERARRDHLSEALNQLTLLRERRNRLLDDNDLPSHTAVRAG